jgi:diaminopimelate decarboxylase
MKTNPPLSFVLAQELLETYSSPLYVYQRDRAQATINRITNAIPYPKTTFQFASVTNGNVNLLNIFRESGWGLHANTPGDIYLGLKAGFSPDQIVYSGSNLDRAEMAQVLHWGITTLNLDSLSQLELFCEVYQELSPEISKPHLGLRLNLPEITGESRIGVRHESFPKALAIVHETGLKLEGLHFYRGTGTNATEAFTEVIDQIIQTCQLLPDWSFLDFGGGFGYAYRHGKIGFNWEQFGESLSQKLQELDREIDLIIEPGRAAIAQCATLLTTIVSEKWQEDKQILGVDTTVANLSVPAVHGGYREIVSWANTNQTYLTDICGNTTYSRDYLGRNCQLPLLKSGDILAILDVGAYGYAMSSHFLHRPRPAEVLLEGDSHRLIRQREDYDVLLEKQVF